MVSFISLDALMLFIDIKTTSSMWIVLRFLMLSRNDISDEAHEQFRAQLPHLDSFHLRVNARGG